MRRRRGIAPFIALIVLAVILVGAGIRTILWWNGSLLPGWITWSEHAYASDMAAEGSVESVVLKSKKLSVYSSGEVIYSSPSSMKVQDVIWQDLDADGEGEILLLYWRRGSDGAQSTELTKESGSGWQQHIAVFDGIAGGMNEVWDSAALSIQASSWRMDTSGRIIITEPAGMQTMWGWSVSGIVPYSLSSAQDTTPVQSVTTENTLNQDETVYQEDTLNQEETQAPPSGNTDASVTFLAVGDDLIHSQIMRYGTNNGDNYDFMFEHMLDSIRAVDFAAINQETVYVDTPEEYSSYPTFGSPIQIGDALVKAGFNIVTCATNHAMDKSLYGVETTANFFESKKDQITYLGIYTRDHWVEDEHEISVIEKNGISFALLNYTYGLNGIPIPSEAPDCVDVFYYDENWYGADEVAYREQKFRRDIARAKELADVVIVFPHWGTEYVYEPDTNQRYWTNVFLECGVDIVVGTHPHVVEPVEMLVREDGHEMLIYYSLGNFISGQDEAPRMLGSMALFTVTKRNGECSVSSYDMIPLMTHQERGGITTTYLMDEYTDELAGRHTLGVDAGSLRQLYRNIIDWNT